MSNWKNYKLSEVVDYENGLWTGKKPPFTLAKVIRATEFNDDGTYNLETAKELEVETKKLKNRAVKPNQILLERSGGGENKPVGRVIFLNDDVGKNTYSFSNFTTLLMPKESVVYPKFLFYYLHFFYSSGQTSNYQKAMIGIRNLEFKRYLEQDIPVPFKNNQSDLEEQKHITDKIDRLFVEVEKGLQKTDKARQDSERLLASELINLFNFAEGKLQEVDFTRYAKIKNGYSFKSGNYVKEGVPLVRIGNLKNQGGVDLSDAKLLPEEFLKQYEDFVIKRGDLLIALSGATTGKVGRYDNDFAALLNQRVGKIVPRDKVLDDFLYYFIISPFAQEQILKLSQGAAQPNLTDKMIQKMKFMIPMKGGEPDVDAQEAIVGRLREIQELAKRVEKELKNQWISLNLLKQSALNYAFAGKLVTVADTAPVPSYTAIPTKVNYFPIQQAIGVIVQSFERGEMVIAKMLYMAQEIYKAPLGIQFTPQNFGPYDAVVKRAMTSGLTTKNQFFAKKRVGGQEVFAPGMRINNLMKYNYSSTKQVRNFLNEVQSLLQSANSPAIERLATICKVIQDNKTTDETAVKTKLQEWKPNKFKDADVTRTLNFIKTKGWDKILTQ